MKFLSLILFSILLIGWYSPATAQKIDDRHMAIYKTMEKINQRSSVKEQATMLYKALSQRYRMAPAEYSLSTLTFLLGKRREMKVQSSRLNLDYAILMALFDYPLKGEHNAKRCERLRDQLSDALILWEASDRDWKSCTGGPGNSTSGTGSFFPGINGGFNEGGGLNILAGTNDPEWSPCETEFQKRQGLANKVNDLIRKVNNACQ